MAELISSTPGRLRLRVRPERRHDAFMRRVQQHVGGRDGVQSVHTIAKTGSVTVNYDPGRHTAQELLGFFRDLGVIAETITTEESPEEAFAGDQSSTATGIVAALDDLDDRVARLTGRRIDLKLLFPAALGSLGVIQIARNGLELGEIPGYILLWYAFDSFYKLHLQSGVKAAAREAEVQAVQEAQPVAAE